jgi:peptidyl-prolyl cis-trans isomerase SurA
MILEKLQLNIAERARLSIDETEVDNALFRLKRSLVEEGISFEDYLGKLQRSEKELREAIRKEITITKVQETTISQRLRITEREIDEFLESRAGEEWLTTRFRLNHILLPVNRDNETEQIKTLQKIQQELSASRVRFSELARQYSGGSNANKGGDLGWRTKDQLPRLFYEAVAELDAGEFTDPVRSNAGFHLLQVVERAGAKPVVVRRYNTRHILVSPSELFTDAEAKVKIDRLHQELQEGADFIELAQQETDDTGSKASGGDLGWSTPGQFVPAFERAMKNTPIGKISQPFRSPFGWHILRVEDVKTEDMFDTVKRNQVANILRQQSFQDELSLWFQELRENTYVEVLI